MTVVSYITFIQPTMQIMMFGHSNLISCLRPVRESGYVRLSQSCRWDAHSANLQIQNSILKFLD